MSECLLLVDDESSNKEYSEYVSMNDRETMLSMCNWKAKRKERKGES
jgi:hypothetical protein